MQNNEMDKFLDKAEERVIAAAIHRVTHCHTPHELMGALRRQWVVIDKVTSAAGSWDEMSALCLKFLSPKDLRGGMREIRDEEKRGRIDFEFGIFLSMSDGIGVTEEEYRELKDAVHAYRGTPEQLEAVKKEATQLAAMALRMCAQILGGNSFRNS